MIKDHTPQELKLIEWYKKASLEIVDILLNTADEKSITNTIRKQRLAEIVKILSSVDEKTQKWIKENIPKFYRRGVYDASQILGDIKEKGYTIYPMGGIDPEPAKILSEEISLNFGNAIQTVKRDSQMRMTALMKTQMQEKIVTGLIRGESMLSKEAIIKDLKKSGVSGFKNTKRRITLRAYADVLVRSQVMTAYNSGAKARILKAGRRFVKITDISPDIDGYDECNKHEGKIYDLLDPNSKLPPFHPNCRHSFRPARFDELTETQRELAEEFYRQMRKKK